MNISTDAGEHGVLGPGSEFSTDACEHGVPGPGSKFPEKSCGHRFLKPLARASARSSFSKLCAPTLWLSLPPSLCHAVTG
eukprot:2568026-Rhodomonas_salina.1